ncbi:MAG: 3'-phosphoesterase [Candidatus Pacearchaeota archaeon]|nr:3'-phosphoesterase [Candidatus Pacearchaeota archaeon]
MALKTYQKKRNFKKTPEPAGKIKASGKKLIFVIHRHEASHLHYDFRLQINNVLRSWAVPKEPPAEKGIKRLAVQVEDHPLEYAKFHGVIPEGNYGTGSVKIWDAGFYELKSKTKNKIEFILQGKKLKGNYVLIKTSYGSKPDKSWLWFKV